MVITEIVEWLQEEFQPLTLATPDTTIQQIVKNAIRYWNTHSAYPKNIMVTPIVSTSDGRAYANIPAYIKRVVNCYPSVMEDNLYSDHPMWVLLGFVTLDSYTADLMLLEHAYNGYKIYLGNDFRWMHQPSIDSTQASKLFLQQIPRNSVKVYVEGTMRIFENDDIVEEQILDWILYYSKALLNITEGNTLRKSDIIGVANDGQALVNEGKADKKELQDKLKKEGRWLLLGKRG